MKRKGLAIGLISILAISFALTFTSLFLMKYINNNGLSFIDEDVIITINGTIANFYARYALVNHANIISYTISLPFAMKPWDINLTIRGDSIPYFWTKTKINQESELFDAINFKVAIYTNEKLDVEVSYNRNYETFWEDEIEYGLYRYIVGSTKSWGEPLNFAHFELWKQNNTSKTLLESRDYTNWMPSETFLYFIFEL
ncbi:MAG: hypothetical protein JXA54_02740 [Candidatus Heimdallarchaeota archaeon]|nr:hypothetical protein [Candidatus Heimdallarchaeota archaeon]